MKAELKYNRQSGFTLIELITSIVILGILSLFSYGIIALNAKTFNFVKNNTIANWDLRRSMQILQQDIQEIRPANLITRSSGKLSSDFLEFIALNGDRITYRRESQSLQKKMNNQDWLTLLKPLRQAPFQFLDINSVVTTNKNKVVFIKVSLVTEKNNKTSTLDGKFYVRN